jgi:3-dehydroquinate synthase
MTTEILKNNGIYFEEESFLQLNRFLKKNTFSRFIILADSHTLSHCYPIVVNGCPCLKEAHLIEIEPGEQHKNLNTCISIWQTLTELKADKQTLLINLGGGVICDIGGFVASTYKRGIPFIHLPTSLLAMADASVGGKCGVDFEGVKNHIGTITQPNSIFIQPAFLNTLPHRHLKNGLAEIIKIAFIADEKLQKQLLLKKAMLDDIIVKSVALKNRIVSKDPFDKGIRQSLNFGHTIGHAIESALLGTRKELLHGEAIAIGMLLESFIAVERKLIIKSHFDTICQMIVSFYPTPAFSKSDMKKMMNFMLHDKKNNNSSVLMSLPKGKASCSIKTSVNMNTIESAFDFYKTIRK